MSARPYMFTSVDETPHQLAAGVTGQVQTLFVRNPHATDGAYVKLYESTAAPTGSSTPTVAIWVAAGSVVLPLFVGMAKVWIVASTDAGAGLTAPPADFVVTATFEPAS